jgi:hypothetical protein
MSRTVLALVLGLAATPAAWASACSPGETCGNIVFDGDSISAGVASGQAGGGYQRLNRLLTGAVVKLVQGHP